MYCQRNGVLPCNVICLKFSLFATSLSMFYDAHGGDVDVGDDCHFADVIAEVMSDDDSAGVGDAVHVFFVVVH